MEPEYVNDFTVSVNDLDENVENNTAKTTPAPRNHPLNLQFISEVNNNVNYGHNVTRGDVVPHKDVKQKLADLAERAEKIKNDPNIRHGFSQSDIDEASKIAEIIEPHQFMVIMSEDWEDEYYT